MCVSVSNLFELVVDFGAMITVTSPKYGVFNCKPLQVIWGKLGQFYSPQNTIMVRPTTFHLSLSLSLS